MDNGAPPSPCPHPAGQQKLLFPARDYITGDSFEIVHCRACKLNRTVPQPAGKEWSRYYPPEYYGAAGGRRFPKLVEALQTRLYARRAQRLETLHGARPGRVLDVGCGRGLLLREFQQRGWEVQGTESSERAAAWARDVLRLPVRVGELAALHFPDEHFDAVVLWHVLEHLPCPQTALAEVARILKRGGILLVAVPNFASVEARWARDKWFHLDVPRHLNHFTPAVLRAQLAAAGLDVARASSFAAEYDAFSLVQSALNRLGLPHNLLYRLLRSSGAKFRHPEHAEHTAAIHTAAILLLAPVLGAFSLPATLLAGLCGTGATLTVHARKTVSTPGAPALTAPR